MDLTIVSKQIPSLVKVAKVVFPKWNDEQAENYVLSELSFLKERIENDYGLAECTEESLIQCFKKSMRDNVTLNKSANLVYIQPQSVKVNGQYVKVAYYSLTPEGKISVVRQSGMIIDITRPKLLKNADGKVIGGEIELLKPSYPKPRWELIEFDESDIERWKKYSHVKNSKGEEKKDSSLKNANALYFSGVAGGIDSEFMRSKIIKHALGKGLGTNKNESLVEKNNAPILDIIEEEIEQVEAVNNLPDYEMSDSEEKFFADELKKATPEEPKQDVSFEDL